MTDESNLREREPAPIYVLAVPKIRTSTASKRAGITLFSQVLWSNSEGFGTTKCLGNKLRKTRLAIICI
jgi:hypothetical protein